MLRVYLDQNKWVDLARAATEHRLGDPFKDALELCRVAVRTGAASFPLDMYRYFETSKRGDGRSRNEVVDIMRELSQDHTMAVPFGILDHEIDLALRRRFGRPDEPRHQQVFGIGLNQISTGRSETQGLDLSDLPQGGDEIPAGQRAKLNKAFKAFVEEQIQRAGPDVFRQAGVDFAALDHGQRFVEFENSIAATITEQGLTGYQIDIAVRLADLGDIRPAVTEALERIAMTWDEFIAGFRPSELVLFMDDLPTRYVTNVMRTAKHRQKQQGWEPNDFIDIVALPVAAVYCDVAITEKQWVHRMRQGKVDKRYGTQILSNAADLVDILVAASVT